MGLLMGHGVRSVILTSGTLAPLKPLISELELNINVRLENPHIVKADQVCLKVLSKGPDNEILNCNYQNRDNPKFLTSLGMTVLNLTRLIPDGLLIFFPSYPILQKCQQFWQENGIWGNINEHKTIYVEPRDKVSFNNVMSEYYSKIQDPSLKGAIFMGVCRGKVSEGLDFADINGRAVIIIGLPYPPLKDPKVILKKRYLDICHAKDKEYLCGNEWYSLEASRAVNQAIGRVIRHQNDYGAIILLDTRFNNTIIRNQMSKWLQEHVKIIQNFGEVVRDLKMFFNNAKVKLPQPKKLASTSISTNSVPTAEFDLSKVYSRKGNFDFSSCSSSCSSSGISLDDSSISSINVQKRFQNHRLENSSKRKKITIVPNSSINSSDSVDQTSLKDYIAMIKKALDIDSFKLFVGAVSSYKENKDFDDLRNSLNRIFQPRPHLSYVIQGFGIYLFKGDKEKFANYWQSIR